MKQYVTYALFVLGGMFVGGIFPKKWGLLVGGIGLILLGFALYLAYQIRRTPATPEK